jgi:uncharacterized protein (DUF433 family)
VAAVPFEQISIDPRVMAGVPCIKGTRIPVTVVLDCFAAGMSEAEILEQYPTLTVEGIRDALRYASACVDARRGAEPPTRELL